MKINRSINVKTMIMWVARILVLAAGACAGCTGWAQNP